MTSYSNFTEHINLVSPKNINTELEKSYFAGISHDKNTPKLLNLQKTYRNTMERSEYSLPLKNYEKPQKKYVKYLIPEYPTTLSNPVHQLLVHPPTVRTRINFQNKTYEPTSSLSSTVGFSLHLEVR